MRRFVAVRRGGLLALTAVAVVAARSADAQEPARMTGTIEVVGMGEVEVAPDLAHLNFAVETSAATSREAAQQNAQQMERVIAALVAAGIRRDSIETLNFSVYPEYVTDDRGENPRVRGYRVTNQVSLKTRRLEAVGTLIDAALEAGANRVEGISFGLSNPQAAEADALREAVQRARASAETIAASLGVQLGAILQASTTNEPVRPMPALARMDMATEAGQGFATPIQPGQQTVHARVVLVYGLVR